jgi:hypothetical protein
MISATEYWKQRFGEEPKTTTDKLACAFASDYSREMWNSALDAACDITDDHYIDEDGNVYVAVSEILKLKK